MKKARKKLNPFIEDIKLKENIRKLLRYIFTLMFLITLYSTSFHYVMLLEGREYSWITGFYWTLTTMSTLGFGDITFQSDLGKAFSILVLFSGLVYLLILFPFVFISFFYTPFMEIQARNKLFQYTPEKNGNHVIITGLDAVAESLIERLESYGIEYVVLADSIEKTKEYREREIITIHGYFDDPNAYKKAHIDTASLVFANSSNEKQNIMATLTIREHNTNIPIITNIQDKDFQDILEMAGCNHILNITESMGSSFSRRCVCENHYFSVIGNIDKLKIWEVPVYGAVFQGMKIGDAIDRLKGLYIVGAWRRGIFIVPELNETLTPDIILVVAGYPEQASVFDGLYRKDLFKGSHVLIIGCGKVGRATAHFLMRMGVDYCFLDNNPEREETARKEGIDIEGRFVLGDGSRSEDLERAGIEKASTIIISSHDDSTNTFLTVYCRKIRENVLILSRSNLERNINTLHRAGADLVISYASLGAVQILNYIRKSKNIFLEEGLEIFQIPVPKSMIGKTIAESNARRETGCSIIGLCKEDKIYPLPSIHDPLPRFGELIIIGSPEAEKRFLEKFRKE